MDDEQRLDVSLRRRDLYEMVKGECTVHAAGCAKRALEGTEPPPTPPDQLMDLVDQLTRWHQKAVAAGRSCDDGSLSIEFTAYDVSYDDEGAAYVSIAIKETDEVNGL